MVKCNAGPRDTKQRKASSVEARRCCLCAAGDRASVTKVEAGEASGEKHQSKPPVVDAADVVVGHLSNIFGTVTTLPHSL